MARKHTLADDLEDDFELDNEYAGTSDAEPEPAPATPATPATAKPAPQKRKAGAAGVEATGSNKRSKSSKFLVPQSAADQVSLWNKYMKKASPGITDLELSDHLMEAKHIYTTETEGEKEGPTWGSATYLEDLARTAVSTGKSKNKVMHGAPQVLVICSSALRVIELVKRLRPVSQKRGVMKLFSRHLKIEEQQKALGSAAVDVAVGTPNRILKLLTGDGKSGGALKVNRLRLVVVDCWQDEKMRVVVDMDDTRKDLFAIWKDVLLPASANPDFGFKFRLV
ncbi:hypothetical protein IWW38_000912 [Coemansia aciculifera]|uniref:Uncharacterized protein n=1 Tax=Coemansia aciculifera TaxID=417176 RepID=A0ACC1M7Q9_9FUNG|nr:hypothetical protein IWW38_000912 [Coemansia aciculifera]